MPVAFDTSASGFTRATVSDGSSNTTITVSVPANVVNGDLMIAVVHNNTALNPGGITAPSGWTQIASNASVNGNFALHSWIGWRIASSEPGSYQWTIGQTVGDDHAWIFRVTGHDSASPIDVTGAFTSDTVLNPVAPSITTTSANALAVWICGAKNGSNLAADDTSVKPTEATQIVYKKSRTNSNGVGTCVAYELRATAGATGTRTFTGTYPTTSAYSSAIGFAIKEATVSGLTITSVNTTNTAFSAQTNSAVVGTGLSASVVCTYAGIICTNESASSSTSLKITFPNFFTNNIKLGRNYEFKVVG